MNQINVFLVRSLKISYENPHFYQKLSQIGESPTIIENTFYNSMHEFVSVGIIKI